MMLCNAVHDFPCASLHTSAKGFSLRRRQRNRTAFGSMTAKPFKDGFACAREGCAVAVELESPVRAQFHSVELEGELRCINALIELPCRLRFLHCVAQRGQPLLHNLSYA